MKFNYNTYNDLIYKADKILWSLRKKDTNEIPEQDLLNVLKKYNLTDAIITIAETYKYIYEQAQTKDLRTFCYLPQGSSYMIRVDALVKIVNLFIKSGANDYRKNKISLNKLPNLIYLCSLVSNHLKTKIPINQNTLLNQLCIIYNEQIELQKDIKTNICRNYILYNEYFGNLFKEKFGISIKEYFNSCFALIVFINKFKIKFTLDEILYAYRMLNNKFGSDEIIKIVINHLSIDYKEYKGKIDIYENKNIIPLQDKPIIKIKERNKEVFIIPLPPLLIEKVYNGIFYDLEKLFQKRNDFTEKFGLIFEKYVGNIVIYYKNNTEIYEEKDLTYKKNGVEAKFVDWSIVDKDITYLIEVKSAVLPLKDIYNETLKNFIIMHIVKAYKQIINKIKDIEQYNELKKVKNKFYKPIIIFRNIPFLNYIQFKNEIEKTIEDYIKNNTDDYFILEYIKTNKIFLFNINDFELYWANRNLIDIDNLFKHIENNTGVSIRSFLSSLTAKLEEHQYLISNFNKIIDYKTI